MSVENRNDNVRDIAIYPLISVIPTALVRIVIGDVQIRLIRAMCDSGSQPNLLMQNVVSKYGLKTIPMQNGLIGVSGEPMRIQRKIRAKNFPWFDSDEYIEIDLWILPKRSKWELSSPDRAIRPIEVDLSHEMRLADPLFWKQMPVPMLLGIGAWGKMVKSKVKQISDSMVQQDTKFDSVILGTNCDEFKILLSEEI